MNPHRRVAVPALAALVLSGTVGILRPSAASAQTLEGRVVDAQMRFPIAGAWVAIVTEDRLSVVGTTASPEGRFSLALPSAGSYWVYASSLGYRPAVDGPFEFEEDGWLELEIRLEPDPVMLDSIRASVERTTDYLRDVGFYERRERGFGDHFTAEEIRRRAIESVTEAFRHLANIYVRGEGFTPVVEMLENGERCVPHVFLDGMYVHRGGRPGQWPPPEPDARPDDFAHPADVAAIEVYRRHSQRPAEFPAFGGCGMIVIWTKH